MLSVEQFVSRVRGYPVIEPETVVADVRARIEAIADEPIRANASAALEMARTRLGRLDLRDCGWPPQSAEHGRNVDLLHADSQKMVSAVVRVDHDERKIFVLKYVLKVTR